MEDETAARFLDQLINSPQLRSQFREDPQGTLEQAGLELNDENRRALEEIDWNQIPDQELAQRISKGRRFYS
jgi:hypothetical protein